MMISAFLDSLHKSCSPSNIISGFCKTGLYPLNFEKPLESSYAMNPSHMLNCKPGTINNMWLTSHEGLIYVFEKKYGRIPQQIDFDININELFRKVRTGNLEKALLLTNLEDFVIEDNETFKLVNF